MTRHQKDIHFNQKFTCPLCNEVGHKVLLTVSRDLGGGGGGWLSKFSLYTCDQSLFKEFRRKESLTVHLNKNICSFLYSCNKCFKKFETPEKLALHIRCNCNKKYQCDLCGDFFKREKDMLDHHKYHGL